VLLTLALVLSASPLAEALQDYGNLDYESCVARLGSARGLGAKDKARADLVLGLCHFALGHEAEARARLEAAFRRDAAVALPPNVSPKEKALLQDVAAAVASSPAPQDHKTRRPVAKRPSAPKDDEPPVVAAHNEPPPAAVRPEPAPPEPPLTSADAPVAAPVLVPAALPQAPAAVEAAPRRTPWVPWLAVGLAVAATGTGVALGVNARSLESSGRAAPVQLDAAKLAADARGNALGANVAFAVAGTAVATAVVTFLVLR
jgi:hypothetical protein